jgi:hypothetical protein
MPSDPPPPVPTQAQADALLERGLGATDESEPATAPPVNVDVPHVSGTGAVGSTLNCTMGNWQGSPTGYSYAWQSDASGEVGTASSYVVAATDAGHSITCIVTATNALGSTPAPPSNAISIA